MAVRCPNCDNTIDESSKFCNSCGHKLDASSQGLCPECGTENPASNIFCDKCGARLFSAIPASDAADDDEGAVRGLSLPSRDPAEDDDAPDWLTQLRSSFGQEVDDSPAVLDDPAPEPASTAEEGDLFSGFDGFLPAETDDKEGKAPGLVDGPEDDIPDWLRDALSGTEPSLADTETPSAHRICLRMLRRQVWKQASCPIG